MHANTRVPHYAVPSAPPTTVTSSDVAPNSSSVQWQTVPCIHQNGDITGYLVRYGVLESEHMEMLLIPGSDVLTTTLHGLQPDTEYLVQVAGVSAQGVGSYRNLTVTTVQSQFDDNTHNMHILTQK